MLGDESVERDGRLGGAAELVFRAVGLDVELVPNERDAVVDLLFRYFAAKRENLAEFANFKVRPDLRLQTREIGIDVEHAVVIVPDEPDAAGPHNGGDARRFDPVVERRVDERVAVEHARNLMELHARAQKRVRDFRDAARLAVGEPFAGHFRAVAERVEGRVVDFRGRL